MENDGWAWRTSRSQRSSCLHLPSAGIPSVGTGVVVRQSLPPKLSPLPGSRMLIKDCELNSEYSENPLECFCKVNLNLIYCCWEAYNGSCLARLLGLKWWDSGVVVVVIMWISVTVVRNNAKAYQEIYMSKLYECQGILHWCCGFGWTEGDHKLYRSKSKKQAKLIWRFVAGVGMFLFIHCKLNE